MKLGYLTQIINKVEDITPEIKSQYGEFNMLSITPNHPDNIYFEIREEDTFLYYMEWGNDCEKYPYIFFKPWTSLEPLLDDNNIKMIYIIDDNENTKLYSRENIINIGCNTDYNLAIIILRGDV